MLKPKKARAKAVKIQRAAPGARNASELKTNRSSKRSQSSLAVKYRRCDPSSSRGSLSRSSGVVASAEILAVSPPWKLRNRRQAWMYLSFARSALHSALSYSSCSA
ncbi:Uncharacterized protein Rs2_20539 [Raphanus sativus]|nr:Uncharacterized protein Rs2_20539 [Raphanus sativus]